MATKTFLLTALVFTLFSCNSTSIQDKPQQQTPKALEDQSSLEIISKGKRGEDLIESLYDELVSKDVELKRLEVKINDLNSSQHDSLDVFRRFDRRIQSYFNSADANLSAIKDSLLRDKIKILITSYLAKYNSRTAKHNELLKTIAANDTSIADLHTILKIVKTLPLIEKYQQDNLPGTKQLEGFIKQQNQAINLADTLIKQ